LRERDSHKQLEVLVVRLQVALVNRVPLEFLGVLDHSIDDIKISTVRDGCLGGEDSDGEQEQELPKTIQKQARLKVSKVASACIMQLVRSLCCTESSMVNLSFGSAMYIHVGRNRAINLHGVWNVVAHSLNLVFAFIAGLPAPPGVALRHFAGSWKKKVNYMMFGLLSLFVAPGIPEAQENKFDSKKAQLHDVTGRIFLELVPTSHSPKCIPRDVLDFSKHPCLPRLQACNTATMNITSDATLL
jgi:hypothetical protein